MIKLLILAAVASVSVKFEAPKDVRYALIQEYYNDMYALDTNLTEEDCRRALPKDQPKKHIRFYCTFDPASN